MSPTPQTRQHISAPQRRQLLVEAALRVMKRDGVAAATTRAICAEAGMGHGMFHYCFHSKRDLFATLLSTDLNSALDAAWGAVQPDATAAVGLKALFLAYWETIESDPDHYLVLTELITTALRDPELRALPAEDHRNYHRAFATQLERFATQAHVRYTVPEASLTEMLLTVLEGVSISWLTHRRDDVARDCLERFAELLAGYTEPDPGAG